MSITTESNEDYIKNTYKFSVTSVLLITFSSLILSMLQNDLISKSSNNLRLFPQIKMGIIIVAGIIMWLVSKKTDVIKIFMNLVIIYTILLTAGGLLINSVSSYSGISMLIGSAIFMSIGIINNLIMISIWGIINRNSSYDFGVKHYVILCLIMFIVRDFILMLLRSIRQHDFVNINVLLILTMASVIALFIVVRRWGHRPQLDHDNAHSKIFSSGFPWFKAAFLLAASMSTYNLFNMYYRVGIAKNIQDSSAVPLAVVIITTCFWFAFSYWAIKNRNWKFAAVWSAIIIIAFTAVFFAYILIVKDPGTLPMIFMLDWLKESKSLVFFPLIQILYLCMPATERFHIKIGTEFIVQPIIGAIPELSYAIGMFIYAPMDASAMFDYLPVLGLIILLVALWMARSIGTKFSAPADKNM